MKFFLENDVENPLPFDLKINNKKVKFVRFCNDFEKLKLYLTSKIII